MKGNALLQEAAQYALLCRISPSLRHRLVGKLQPIGIMTALVERQLQGDHPNVAGARDTIAKAQHRVREAMLSSVATLAWLTGEETNAIAWNEGVAECVDLIRTDSIMRGVTIVSRVMPTEARVSKSALRLVLTAVLIAMVDTSAPSRIELQSSVSHKQIELWFDIQAVVLGDIADTFIPPQHERLLTWADVEALAELAGVAVVRSTTYPMSVRCRFDVIGAGSAVANVRKSPPRSVSRVGSDAQVAATIKKTALSPLASATPAGTTLCNAPGGVRDIGRGCSIADLGARQAVRDSRGIPWP